jgi:PIN domain nuclease of toxin-antitoxin system
MLSSQRRISLTLPLQEWRRKVLSTPGIVEVPLSGDAAIEAVQLPGRLHDDPADRMLIATARLNGWLLATRDDRILSYAAEGHLKILKV